MHFPDCLSLYIYKHQCYLSGMRNKLIDLFAIHHLHPPLQAPFCKTHFDDAVYIL